MTRPSRLESNRKILHMSATVRFDAAFQRPDSWLDLCAVGSGVVNYLRDARDHKLCPWGLFYVGGVRSVHRNLLFYPEFLVGFGIRTAHHGSVWGRVRDGLFQALVRSSTPLHHVAHLRPHAGPPGFYEAYVRQYGSTFRDSAITRGSRLIWDSCIIRVIASS